MEHMRFFLCIVFLCAMIDCIVSGSPPSVPQSGGPVILELPLDKIRRPLMRTRANDPQKVKELMESISEIGLQVPVSMPTLLVFLYLSTSHCILCKLLLLVLSIVRLVI